MADSAQLATAASVAFSFTLVGNAITQCFMSIPALLAGFPKPGNPEHAASARRLGRQWKEFLFGGEKFFRPTNTLGLLGYSFAALKSAKATPASTPSFSSSADWKLLAVAAGCNFLVILHSAGNMQPLNRKICHLAELGDEKEITGVEARELATAEGYARTWIRYNVLRILLPLVAGIAGLSQLVEH
ncbi:hypothetical protein VTK73DRAFT_6528 [Phialemonium thermophilum]|uniref:Uncharacterized protein n=1 Tax=Phialemonium thermophilum TaxID=223376 RepID=A0ABR3XVC2_9PEZI